jgi:hypothetical protein
MRMWCFITVSHCISMWIVVLEDNFGWKGEYNLKSFSNFKLRGKSQETEVQGALPSFLFC